MSVTATLRAATVAVALTAIVSAGLGPAAAAPTPTPSATPILIPSGPYPKTGSSAIDAVFHVFNSIACGAVCWSTWPNETPWFPGSL
ncbi:hypothetical protein [Nocardia sp. NPDC058666]|uniref:hypothetical protein n=1 Tax=unclassified Nocardia TaxID=2637762 RepID=UPI0036637F6D